LAMMTPCGMANCSRPILRGALT